MINKTIGRIILKGGTSKELRKEIKDFPLNPTKDYFIKLGYKESTAKKYLARLRKNEEKSSTSSIIESTEILEDLTEQARFIESENVDYTNLLIDTCALRCSETVEVIEQAKHVTFIKATIEEMDKQKQKKGRKKLALNIRLYTEKILLDSQKYMLSSFPGFNKENYPDNILLQYLLILPKQLRPTLFTADKNLAVKAKMWDLPYILYQVPENKKEGQDISTKKKKVGYGIWKINEEGKSYIVNNGNFSAIIIRQDGSVITLGKGNKVKHVSGDKVCVNERIYGEIFPRYMEVK